MLSYGVGVGVFFFLFSFFFFGGGAAAAGGGGELLGLRALNITISGNYSLVFFKWIICLLECWVSSYRP